MLMTILKAVGTVAVVIIISEVQKRSNVLAAAIAALPCWWRSAPRMARSRPWR